MRHPAELETGLTHSVLQDLDMLGILGAACALEGVDPTTILWLSVEDEAALPRAA